MKKILPLILFIVGYLIIWDGITLLIHSQTSISPDTVENIMWSMNHSLMNDKHPGLGGLFLLPFISVFPPLLANLFAVTVCILVTWIFLYKTLRLYFDSKEAVFVTLLSILSFFYMGEFFIQYNQNTILFPFWAASVYFFLKAIKSNNLKFWILTSLFGVFGFYAKFQIGLVAVSMLFYLIFNYHRSYTKNILFAILVAILALFPGLISLYKIDFLTISYMMDRVQEPTTGVIYNILYAMFDSVFQLLNFSIAIIVVTYLKFKGGIARHSNQLSNRQKALVYVGVIPYVIFCILEAVKGMLPTEWLVCSTMFVFPAFYILLKLKLREVNFIRIVVLGLIINLVYFVSFNLNTFTDREIEHNNIGDSVAIAAENFLKDKNLETPNYASGNWRYGFYLTVFMKNHPKYIRDLSNTKIKSSILAIYPGCSNQVNPEVSGYKIVSQSCEQVKLIDKLYPQEQPFTFYVIKKQ